MRSTRPSWFGGTQEEWEQMTPEQALEMGMALMAACSPAAARAQRARDQRKGR